MQNITSSDSSLGKFQPEEKSHQDDKPIDEPSVNSPCASPAAKKKKLVNTQETNNKSVDKIDHLADHLEYSMLESLKWKTESGFDRIFSELRTDEDCPDLLSLSKVSRIFHKEVPKFMRKDCNRPGLKQVTMTKVRGGLEVVIILFPSNIPFHDLTSLDWGRFERSKEYSVPKLRVTLTGPEDPIIKQVSNLLTSPIQEVVIGEYRNTRFPPDLSMCATLLGASTISQLVFYHLFLNDFTAPFIPSIISRATNDLYIWLHHRPQLTNPAFFINDLCSSSIGHICLSDGMSSPPNFFFGIPHSFWEKITKEKLSNGSFEWVEITTLRGKVIRNSPPFVLPDTPFKYLEWQTVKKK